MSRSAYKAVSRCAMEENNSPHASVATQATTRHGTYTPNFMTFSLTPKTEAILTKQLIAAVTRYLQSLVSDVSISYSVLCLKFVLRAERRIGNVEWDEAWAYKQSLPYQVTFFTNQASLPHGREGEQVVSKKKVTRSHSKLFVWRVKFCFAFYSILIFKNPPKHIQYYFNINFR